jgi:hypothetical protein
VETNHPRVRDSEPPRQRNQNPELCLQLDNGLQGVLRHDLYPRVPSLHAQLTKLRTLPMHSLISNTARFEFLYRVSEL